MSLKLIKLTKAYKEQLEEMINEWRADQELNHTNHSPWAVFKNDPQAVSAYRGEYMSDYAWASFTEASLDQKQKTRVNR